MVDLYVGPVREHYIVHKELLCTKVPYFEAMFGGSNFREALEGTASFPEDQEVAFDLLLNWIYTGTIPPLLNKHKNGAKTFSSNVVDFYVLADKFCLSELQDRIIDACRASLLAENALPTADFTSYAYSQTSANSPLRKFAVVAARYTLRLEYENTVARYKLQQESANTVSRVEFGRSVHTFLENHKDIWSDILSLVKNSKETGDPMNLPACAFHRHGEKDDCYRVRGGKNENASPKSKMSKIRDSKIRIPFHGFFEDEDEPKEEPQEELPATFKEYVCHIYVELQES
jgi:hypothetical protein